jgi:hypothetical protein
MFSVAFTCEVICKRPIWHIKLLQTVHKAGEVVSNKALDQIYRSLIEDNYKT